MPGRPIPGALPWQVLAARRASYGAPVVPVVRHVNSLNIAASSSGAVAYTATIPAGTGIQAGDLIVVAGNSNGTHSANGMAAQDSVNAVPFTVGLETDLSGASSRWLQTLWYVTPQAIADLSTISFTPYAAASASAFTVDVFRATSGAIVGPFLGTTPSAGAQFTGPALALAPPAQSLVVSAASFSTGTLRPWGAFTLGSASQGTTPAVALGYCLAATGVDRYTCVWDDGAGGSQSCAGQVVAFGVTAGGSTPAALADAGTGADTLTVAVTGALADAGTGSDTLAASVTASLADTGTGADTVTTSATAGLADTGAGTDTLAAQVTAPLADSGTGTDTLTTTTGGPPPLNDSGTGADTVTASVTAPVADSGAASDSATIAATVPLTDTGAGSHTVAVAVVAPLADAGTGADSLAVTVPRALADAGAGSDALALAATAALPDAGSAADSLAASAAAGLADTGRGADTLTVSISGATPPPTLDAGAPHTSWATDSPHTSWAAGAPHVNAWSSGRAHGSYDAGVPHPGWTAGPPHA